MYTAGRPPDFRELATVLEKGRPSRPVLFDFIIGDRLERLLAGPRYRNAGEYERLVSRMAAFENAGYDFAPVIVRGLTFVREGVEQAQTKSLNAGHTIVDRAGFDAYCWPETDDCDFDILLKVASVMPAGMKLIPFSLDGVLENTISLTGYENLCFMLYEDRQLAADIFENVGSRLLRYFERCLEYDAVGAIIQNDDWGFNTQPLLSPDDLREFVFPWHKRMAAAAHARGKYAVLHSCGNFLPILDDIYDIGVDGRHSYQDVILPVEQAYPQLQGRIAVLGGIDVDFLARATPEDVEARCRAMLALADEAGGYALGSGNSVPDYVPDDNYLALLRAASQH